MITVAVVSLGCVKNRVDTELMLGILERDGFAVTADERRADVLIVNTCGFIEPAKEESIDTLLSLAHVVADRALCTSGRRREHGRGQGPTRLSRFSE